MAKLNNRWIHCNFSANDSTDLKIKSFYTQNSLISYLTKWRVSESDYQVEMQFNGETGIKGSNGVIPTETVKYTG